MTEAEKTPPARRCPICGKPAVERYRPFCSKRCADVDLNRWLKGGYAIPGAPDAEEDGEPSGAGRTREED
ncbi:MAG TPA: DNA gyrase inhibitor YacG [Rhodoblastus sp.]|nr:DNA gyrase inhibitor YacG [Rhodoblastus sp.]